MDMDDIVEMCINQEQQAIDLYTLARDQAKDDAVIPPLLVPVDIRVFSCVIQPIFPRS